MTPNHSKPPQFRVPFHIFVADDRRYFKFDLWVERIKSQPIQMSDRPEMGVVTSRDQV